MSNVTPVTVKVIYKPGKNPNVDLTSDDLPIVDGKLIFKNSGNDGFWVKFVLDDVSLAGYRFVNSGMSPMYSAVATDDQIPCPKSGVWSKFQPHNVDERSLLVRNKNGVLPNDKKEERFGFTLRVTKDPDGNGPVVELDPGAINQNGGVKASPWMSTALLVGVAVGVIATLGVQTLLPG